MLAFGSRIHAAMTAALTSTDARRVTAYLSPTLTVKVTRQRRYSGRNRPETFIVTVGRPNWRERKFIAQCRKVREPFPVKKLQFDAWPVRKPKAPKAKRRRR